VYCDVNIHDVSKSLSDQLGLNSTQNLDEAKVAIMDDASEYYRNIEKWNKWVKNGGKIVFLDLPIGSYEFEGKKVSIAPTFMGHYFFVSPRTSHPLTKNNHPFDFFCWYDEKTGLIEPILTRTIQGEGWNAILKTGIPGDNDGDKNYLAAAELELENGKIIINNLLLDNRVGMNPVARNYAYDLLFSKSK